jgi:CubicO group peptidase (beta-lactamase class C family)
MRRRLVAVAIVVAGTVAAVFGGSVAPTEPGQATREYLGRLEKLGLAGVVVATRDGTPLVADGVGLADRERGLRWTPATVSTIGSITKQFTAAAILALEEDGKLRVEDALSRHFPGTPADKAPITLHQLLTHSSGIVDLPDLGDWDPIGRGEFAQRALAQPLAFAPGTGYEYSNANYSLLGAIVEQQSGVSWERFVRDRLWLPSGMFETGYVLPDWGDGRMAQGYRGAERWGTILERPMAPDGPHWGLRANGGVHAPAWDMVRWAHALLAGRVLSPASIARLWSPVVPEGGGSHYGYGWAVRDADGVRVVSHNGGNGIHFADLGIVPATRTVVFLQTNVIADVAVGNRLLEQVLRHLAANRPYPDVPVVVSGSADRLRAVEGTYGLPSGGAIRITTDGVRLVPEADGRDAFAWLHSTRGVDLLRSSRLSSVLQTVLDASLRGDYEPMRRARGDDVSAEQLARRFGEWRAEQEAERGSLSGVEVLGAALQEGRDVALARYRFERGTLERAFVFDPEHEGRIQGVSQRGMRPPLVFVPVGEDRFASWDGGLSSSRPMVFGRDGAGRATLTLGIAPAAVTATR